jgi:hypothetical protein
MIALAFTTISLQSASAGTVTPPSVPTIIQVPAGNKAFLVGHAEGTQNYICLPSGTGVKFVLFTPQATLFSGDGGQIITHFFSPNPSEANKDLKVLDSHAIRPTWQDSKDTSAVWGRLHQNPDGSNASVIVDASAIPWLLLDVAGAQDGPSGGKRLSVTTFIHRLNTQGGLAPATGCSSFEDIGRSVFVPYSADYYFYKSSGS